MKEKIEYIAPEVKAVLFDLDGTLLPMDQNVFVKTYFGLLAKKAAPHGYEPKRLVEVIWKGTSAMVKNDGTRTNEDVFWDVFANEFGEASRAEKTVFDAFYENEFEEVRSVCGFDPECVKTVHDLKANGYRVILATNPIFPMVATRARLRWAGFTPDDFEFITTYENSYYCKPNPKYYEAILEKLSLSPEECMMVGNDVLEDIIPTQGLGMKTHLLTDCLIDKREKSGL